MLAIVVRGHLRDTLSSPLLCNLLRPYSNASDIFVHTWDRYETSLSWSRRDKNEIRRVVRASHVEEYFKPLAPKLVKIHRSSEYATDCRVWNAPCQNHITTFRHFRDIYHGLVHYRRIVSLRCDIFSISRANSLAKHVLAPHRVSILLRLHADSESSFSFLLGKCEKAVALDAIMSGAPSHLIAHAKHVIATWGTNLTLRYPQNAHHHEFLLVDLAMELRIC